MIGPCYSKNGILGAVEAALVPVDDIHFEYGYGVYETLKLRGGIVYFPQLHIERLMHSASLIGLHHDFLPTKILNWIDALVVKNKNSDANIKILLIGSDRYTGGAELYIMELSPLFPRRQDYRDGTSAILFRGERWLPQAKSLNMLMSTIAYREAREAGAYDAILVDREEFLREGTRTNLFFTDGKAFYSPPALGVLAGVTRSTVIQAMQEYGFAFFEKPLHISHLQNPELVEGLLLTSTSTKIMPLQLIKGFSGDGDKEFVFSVPEIVVRLIKDYDLWLADWRNSQKSSLI